jgi:uncharacterized protein YjbI with pentapeptide repeats
VADDAQVKILKEEGVEAWNEWRRARPRENPQLAGAILNRAKIKGVDLNGANLHEVQFRGAVLRQADLRMANIEFANLEGADLRDARLWKARLYHSRLSNAKLIGADMRETNCAHSRFHAAILRRCNLSQMNLNGASLESADLTEATMGETVLGNLDLSKTLGLETVRHIAPSVIGIDTIYRSGGNIPEAFLRGAGVPEPFIVNMKSLVAAMSPIEFYSCFISYSNIDQEFATRLYADLRNEGVRCWFAPEDLKIGDKLRPSFDEAIRLHDKLMVLLSEDSVNSPWVEKEVETAFERERREKRTVLFPIRLDDAVMETEQAWAADIRRTRHIGDFRKWKNHDSYKQAFERLLRDLKASA